MYTKAREHSENFDSLSDTLKMCFILSSDLCVKVTAKTCWEILKRRRNLLNNTKCYRTVLALKCFVVLR